MDKNCRKASSQMSRAERADLKDGARPRPKVNKGAAMALAVCFTLLFTSFAGFQFVNGNAAYADDNVSNIMPPTFAAPNDTWFVTNSGDSGEAGSLRSILSIAGDGDMIIFDPKVDWGASPIVLNREITFGQKNLMIDGGAGVTLKGTFGHRLMQSNASNGTLTLNAITFEGSDGGGLIVYGDVFMTNCKFIDNIVEGNAYGGGLCARETATLIDCTFINNLAGEGGGGAFVGDSATLINCTFIGNKAYQAGGLYVLNGTATLTNCKFTDNKAYGAGGAISLVFADAIMTNCTFTGNNVTVNNGGAVETLNGDLELIDCKFNNNAAGRYGGAVYSQRGDISVTGSMFNGNKAVNDGGAIYALGSGPSGHMVIKNSGFAHNTSNGSIVYSVDGTVTATNTTFYANTAESSVSAAVRASTVTITHCTFTENKGPYNINAIVSINANNNLMTADKVTVNANKALTGSGNTVRTHAIAFGNNTLTFNYIMPAQNLGNVSVIAGYEKDAAGNTRTASKCLPGAINWDAVSFKVTNGNDSGPGSLRECINTIATGYNRDLVSWFVVHFADDVSRVDLASSLIYDKAVMLYGRLDANGEPDVTLDGGGKVRVINHTANSSLSNNKAYFYGLTIQNGYSSGANGGAGALLSAADAYFDSCNFIGNVSVGTGSDSRGGGLSAQGEKVSLVNCKFINNSSANAGGGAYLLYAQTMVNCVFVGNKSAEGGGLYASFDTNKFMLINCVFIGNQAGKGGAVYFDAYASASLSIARAIVNTTISENVTTGPNSGAFECGGEVQILQTTISNNIGGGLRIMNVASSAVYLYNSIIAGNVGIDGTTPQQILGDRFTNISSLIEGKNAPGSSVPVTARQVFGMNMLDRATGSHSVLSNGIAYGKATPVTAFLGAKLYEEEWKNVVTALTRDQHGVPRTGTNVSYGAVEIPRHWLLAVSVTKDPDKVRYTLNEMIVLAGTEITLDYSNGYESFIRYDEPGMTNTSSKVDMSTPGEKRIDFTFLGVSTKDDTCVRITAEQLYSLTYDLNGGIPGTGPENVSYLFAQNDYVLDATIPTHTGDGTSVLFIGWTYERLEKIHSKSDALPMTVKVLDITDDTTVYAVWGYDTNGDGIPDVKQLWFNIKYNVNGGSDGPGAQSVLKGTYEMSKIEPKRSDALFMGWTLDAGVLDRILGKGDEIPELKSDDIVIIDGDVTLYAVWGYDTNGDGTPDVEQEWFNIIYNVNGGSGGPSAQSVIPGKHSLSDVKPLYTGVLFMGWTLDHGISGKILDKGDTIPDLETDVTVVDKDVTVYAVWGYDSNGDNIPDAEQEWFNIIYNVNGGSGGPGTLSVLKGEYEISKTEPTRAGVLFMGWTLDGVITGKVLGKGDTIPKLETDVTVVDKDVTLYAVWGYDTNNDGKPDAEQEWFTITYDANGGHREPKPQSVIAGTYPLPDVKPLYTGVLFMGWTLDDDILGKVLGKGDTIPKLETEILVSDDDVTLYAVWGSDSNGDNIPDAEQQWFNIIYNVNGGSGGPGPLSVVPGTYSISEIEPVHASALFMGGTLDKTILGKVLGKGDAIPKLETDVTVVDEDVTLYAVWGSDSNGDNIPDAEQQWFNIIYNVNGGSGGPGPLSVVPGTYSISEIEPVHASALFMGGTLDKSILGKVLGKGDAIPKLETTVTVVDEDVTLYAVWGHDTNNDGKPDVEQEWFNIIYNANGGHRGPRVQNVVPGTYPIPDVKPLHLSALFIGWTLDKAILGKVLEKGDTLPKLETDVTVADGDVILYAVWGLDTNGDNIPDAEQEWFTITYDANGGSGGPGVLSVVSGPHLISDVKPLHASALFMGWTLDGVITGKVLGKGDAIPYLETDVTVADGDVILYAVWGLDTNGDGTPDAEQEWFTITYDANGGSGGPGVVSVISGTHAASKIKPTHASAVFMGWTLDDDIAGKVLDRGDAIPELKKNITVADDDVTVYAVWGIDTNGDGIPDVTQEWFTITYDANGGSGGPGVLSVVSGLHLISSIEPTYAADILFIGWTLDISILEKILEKGDTMPDIISKVTISDDETILYAVWGVDTTGDGIPDVKENWFNITYHNNGGSGGPGVLSVLEGIYKISTIEPTHASALFMGWTLDNAVVGKILGKNGTIPVFESDVTVNGSNVTLYAVWGLDSNGDGIPDVEQVWFNITYHANGGSGGPGMLSVLQGTHTIPTTEPTYAGLLFIGWTLDRSIWGEILGEGDTLPKLELDVIVIDSDVTLYAVWGYDVNGDGIPDVTQKWFNIIYDVNGGSEGPETLNVVSGKYPIADEKPLHASAIFMGWTLDITMIGKVLGKEGTMPMLASEVLVIDDDVTLYAVWGLDTNGDGKPDVTQEWFNIIYDVNGGSEGPETLNVVSGKYPIADGKPLHASAIFMGWTLDITMIGKVLGKEGTLPVLVSEILVDDDDVILYAVWGSDTNGDGIADMEQDWFTITYNANKGHGGPGMLSVVSGTYPIPDAKPLRASAIFMGWTLDSSIFGKVLGKGGIVPELATEVLVIDGDVTLYAVWGLDTNGDGTPDVEQDWFSITYNANGGSGGPGMLSVVSGTYPIPDAKPLHASAIFMGWTLDSSVFGKVLGKGGIVPELATEVLVIDGDVILYAVWGLDTNGDGTPDVEQEWFKIIYNANGGSGGPKTESVVSGTHMISTIEPTHANAIFMGWTLDIGILDKILGKGDTIPALASDVTVTDGNVTLYAVWGSDTNGDGIPDAEQQWFSIIYNANGGSKGPETMNVVSGTYPLSDVRPLHAGALFIGWTLNGSILDKILGKGDIMPVLVTDVTVTDGNVTLYAVWGYDTNGDGTPDVEQDWFTITYNTNSGSGGPGKLSVVPGIHAISMIEPTYTGALFMGWTLDIGTLGKILGKGDTIPTLASDVTVVNSDVILYAVWGYDSNGDGTPDAEQQWFNIIYNVNGGSKGPETMNVVPGKYTISTIEPIHVSALFMGWTLDIGILDKILGKGDTIPALASDVIVTDGNVTLYAVWGSDINGDGIPDAEQDWFSIIYNANGGSGGPGTLSVIPGVYTISTTEPTYAGAIFMGWTFDIGILDKILGKGDKIPVLESEVTVTDGDVILYAVWGYDTNGDGIPDAEQEWFTITYDANGGSGGPGTFSVVPGTYTVSSIKPTYAGVLFMGWTFDIGILDKILGKGDMIPAPASDVTVTDGNVTLYAVWGYDTNGDGTPDAEQDWFSIIYNVNEGSGGPGILSVVPGTYTISAIGPTYTGALFIGWTLNGSVLGKVLGKGEAIPALASDVTVVDSDVTLYAVWGYDTNGDGIPDAEQEWFTITYDANGGSGGPGKLSVLSGTHPLSAVKPSYPEAIFMGWTLDIGILDKILGKGDTIPVLTSDVTVDDGDVTLYAVWGYDENGDGIPDAEQEWFTITYDANGGSGGPGKLSVIPGTYTVSSIKPTYAGVLFIGWTFDIGILDKILGKGDTIPVSASDITVSDDDVTLYAVWGHDANGDGVPDAEQKWFNITYHANGGSKGPETLSVVPGTYPISAVKPLHTEALFVGWTLDAGILGEILSKGDTIPALAWDVTVTDGNVTLYAVWGYDTDGDGIPDVKENWFDIMYDANGGSGGPGVLSVMSGKYPVSAVKPLYTGLIFMGWTLDGSVAGAILGKGDTIPVLESEVTVTDDDVTLYAVWGYDENGDGIPDVNQKWFTITYDANGGSGGPGKLNVISGKHPVPALKPLYTGVIFMGWTIDGSVMDKILGKGDTIPALESEVTVTDDDVTLYAVWGYDENGDGIPDVTQKWFNIIYNANGGSGGPGTLSVLFGTYTISPIEPTYAGVLFMGWTLDSSVLGTVLGKYDTIPVPASDVNVVDGDVTLYAVWGYDENGDGIPDAEQEWYTLSSTRMAYGKIRWSVDSVTYFDLSGAASVLAGATVYLKATAGEGMRFYAWTNDLAGNEPEKVLLMDEDKVIGAIFHGADDPTLYSSYSAGGNIQWSVDGDAWDDLPSVLVIPADQTSVFLKVIVYDGYWFYSWTGDLAGNEITMELFLGGDKTVGAEFRPVSEPTHVLTSSVSGYGKIQWSADGITYADLSASLTVPAGATIHLKGVEYSGAEFFGWTGDLTGTFAIETLLMDSDKSVCAMFTACCVDPTEDDENGSGHSLSLIWWFLLALLLFLFLFLLLRDRFTLTYDPNGGTKGTGRGKERGLVAQEGHELDLMNVPEHGDHIGRKVAFVGWSSEPDGKIYSMADNAPVTITSVDIVDRDVTVYAVWGYDTDGDGIPDVTEYSYTSTIAEGMTKPVGMRTPDFRIRERRRRGLDRLRL